VLCNDALTNKSTVFKFEIQLEALCFLVGDD
jgi:hypothetical protein